MTLFLDISRLVDEAIHRAILEFDPDVAGSYQKWGEVMADLEQRIETSSLDAMVRRSLILRILAQLALMASMANEHSQAEIFAERILSIASPEEPCHGFAVLTLTSSLHQLGRHEEEIEEGLRHAESHTLPGQAMLHLLSELVRNHPGEIVWREPLISLVRDYVRESSELSRNVESSHLSEANPEEYILGVKSIARKLNRERMARARERASEG